MLKLFGKIAKKSIQNSKNLFGTLSEINDKYPYKFKGLQKIP